MEDKSMNKPINELIDTIIDIRDNYILDHDPTSSQSDDLMQVALLLRTQAHRPVEPALVITPAEMRALAYLLVGYAHDSFFEPITHFTYHHTLYFIDDDPGIIESILPIVELAAHDETAKDYPDLATISLHSKMSRYCRTHIVTLKEDDDND